PISNIDGRVIGSGTCGAVTKRLQKAYFDVVYGHNKKYQSFLTYI
ncbi:MAG: branched chain amino acid aminotransferase, partial [Campylobacter curvus]